MARGNGWLFRLSKIKYFELNNLSHAVKIGSSYFLSSSHFLMIVVVDKNDFPAQAPEI